MPTTFNDGATHNLNTGSYSGIIVDLTTTVNMAGATSTGPDGFSNWPPGTVSGGVFTGSFGAAESGIAAVLVTGQSVLNVGGSASLKGGDSAAGTSNRGTSPTGTPSYFTAMDGTPDYNLAAAFGAAPCVLSIPNNVSGSILGSNITLGGSGTLTGGSHNASSAVGTIPSFGAPAALIQWPSAFVLTDSITLQGGNSEATLPGAAGLVLMLGGTVGATLGGPTSTPVVLGGSGVSTGPSASIQNQGTGRVDLGGGPWANGINLTFAAGSTFRVIWGSIPGNTLTTSLISGTLEDGTAVSIALTGGAGATVYNSGSVYSELQF